MKKNQLKLRKEVIAALSNTQMNIVIGGRSGDIEEEPPTGYYSCFCPTENCCSGDCVATWEYYASCADISCNNCEETYDTCEVDVDW